MKKNWNTEQTEYTETMLNYLSNPSMYVAKWLLDNEVSFAVNGSNKYKGTTTSDYTTERIFNLLWLDYEKEFREHIRPNVLFFKTLPHLKPDFIKETTMLKSFYEAKHKFIDETKLALKNSLFFKPGASKDGLSKWLTALTGQVNPLDLAVMQHFIWGIKTRMKGKYPEHIKFPIIYGQRQQTGKTTAIRKLIAPLQYFKLDKNVDEVLDERNLKVLSQFYVCFLDEMAGMQRAEVEQLKRVITAETISYRPMRSNENETVFVTCSFIGASNKPLDELVFDTTGQARFWQINALDNIDWEAINSINYLEIWQSIDENLEKGYITEVLEELRKHQELSTMEDFIKIFLDESGFMPNTHDKFITVAEVHIAYESFCALHGEKPRSAAWFSRIAKKYGIKQHTIAGRGRGYKVNKEFLAKSEKTIAQSEALKWNQ